MTPFAALGASGKPSGKPGSAPRPPSRAGGSSPFAASGKSDANWERWREWETAREENLQKAIELLEPLVSAYPTAPDYRHLLARCYRELGPSWLGRSARPSSDSVEKAAKILQELVQEHPDVPDYRHDLSLTYARQSAAGPFAPGAGDPAAEQRRREMLDKALTISDELVAEHPNIPDYAVFQVHVRLRQANMLWESESSRAEAGLRKALDVQTSLVRRFPQSPFYTMGLGIIQESLAVFLRDRGQLPEARRLMESCIASFQGPWQKDPKFGFLRGALAQNYRNLADILRRLNDEKAAADAARQADAIDPRK